MTRIPLAPAPQTPEELLQRLEEAEETIRAIRDGEVDAFVVRRTRDEEIFTLQGGQDSYRAFMETMGHGAAALGARGEILYANAVLTALIGKPPFRMRGQLLVNQFEPPISQQLKTLLGEAEPSSGGSNCCEISLRRGGEIGHYLASAERLQIGVVDGWAVTFTDLTDSVRAQESLSAERAARAIIASANEAVVVCDAAGLISHVNAAVLAITDGAVLGKRFHEAVKLKINDASGPLSTEELVRMAIAGTAVKGLEAHAPEAPRAKDLLISAAPLCLSDGASNGCVITMVDLSQRKAAEERQRFLMAELDHRVKNVLTLVISILHQTESSNIEQFKTTFARRIDALAATHSLLAIHSWVTLPLEELFKAELAPYVVASSDRVEITGQKLELKPRSAVAVGLILHELVSNAVKYGALSTPNGRITLSVLPRNANGYVQVEWLETGGPLVATPRRKGFGRTVIAHSLKYAPSGGADLEFLESGVRCALRIPSEDIVEGGAQ